MRLKYTVVTFTLAFSALLSGCHQSSPTDTASIQKQNEQLASLVAAGEYLRERCKDRAVPDNEMLIRRATEEGTLRGWSMDAQRAEAIRKEAAFRYQALTDNPTQHEKSCSTLNEVAAPFVYTVK